MRYKEIITLLEMMEVPIEQEPLMKMLIDHFRNERKINNYFFIGMCGLLIGLVLGIVMGIIPFTVVKH